MYQLDVTKLNSDDAVTEAQASSKSQRAVNQTMLVLC
jgi:hypothetical protein